MYIRIVRHWCKEGRGEAGRAHMDSVGKITAESPGFLYRYHMEESGDPEVLTSLTAWRDEAAFGAFRASRPTGDAKDPSYPFARVEHHAYTVKSTIGERQ
jgi:heme-degrading monooxygenase HmoA